MCARMPRSHSPARAGRSPARGWLEKDPTGPPFTLPTDHVAVPEPGRSLAIDNGASLRIVDDQVACRADARDGRHSIHAICAICVHSPRLTAGHLPSGAAKRAQNRATASRNASNAGPTSERHREGKLVSFPWSRDYYLPSSCRPLAQGWGGRIFLGSEDQPWPTAGRVASPTLKPWDCFIRAL
jgi:hypothetical protein